MMDKKEAAGKSPCRFSKTTVLENFEKIMKTKNPKSNQLAFRISCCINNHRLCRWSVKSFSDEKKQKNSFWCKIDLRSGNCKKHQKEDIQMNDNRSLAHTTWNCKYHIVFATLI
jgi:hypothetical protein